MTIFVAIIDADKINQFYRLPNVFQHQGTEYRIVHLESDKGIHTFSGTGATTAFDMIIKPTFNELSYPDFHPELNMVYLNRFDKIHQQRLLNDFMAKIKPSKSAAYIHLGAIPVDMETFYFGEFTGQGVLKPISGARGMGIMKFSTQETNLRAFLVALEEVIRDGDKNNRAIQKLCDNFNVELNVGKENHDDEMYGILNKGKLVLQRHNPYNDIEEFRVLKTLDEVHFYHRDHFGKEDKNIIDRSYPFSPALDKDDEFNLMMEDIKKIIRMEDFPLVHGSIDVWVSRKGMKWGIYEYQNQYGHVHIHEGSHNDFLKSTIDLLYQKLNGE